jgi:ferredoxin--NADP+ reductase
MLTDSEIATLRQSHYNATVVGVRRVHGSLAVLRILPDAGIPRFAPGQYTTLGLGNWELAKLDGFAETSHASSLEHLVRRSYSFSCSILDDAANLRRPHEFPYVEFFLTLVRPTNSHRVLLTPGLFGLSEGDRLAFGPKIVGKYTLDCIRPDDDVILAATGTGEAPHNAMAAELLATGHAGRVVVVTCVRHEIDLAYLIAHRELERRHANYQYVALTTREPRNIDPSLPGYVGKRYLQEYFTAGAFERETGKQLAPLRTHVFLCGNPRMIGAPVRRADGSLEYPQPKGMVEALVERGFSVDQPNHLGNVHFEKYW